MQGKREEGRGKSKGRCPNNNVLGYSRHVSSSLFPSISSLFLRFCLRGMVLAGLLAGLGGHAQSAPGEAPTLAIRAETLLPVATGPIKNGVILIRAGRIVAIGANLPIPPGTRVIRAKVAMPGLVDAHSYLGCYYETDEGIDAVTPDLRIRDTFDPHTPLLRQAVRAGITTVCVMPGNRNAIAGQASLYKLGTEPQMLRDYAGQKFSISTDATNPQRNPTSRAGVVELVRSALDGAAKGSAVSSTSQTRLMVGFPTTLSERNRALSAVLKGQAPAWIHAPTADDAENALQLMDAYHLQGCLLHANEAAPVADQLRARKIPVVLGPLRFTDSERVLANAGRLARAGVKIAFCTDAPLTDPASLRQSALLAVRYGLRPEAALRALTLDAAGILGVAGRTGSLEVGKDADVLLLSGDPLNLTSRVEAVVSMGKIVYEAGP
jgi:imidazolonepropionase-like amidohydrolase